MTDAGDRAGDLGPLEAMPASLRDERIASRVGQRARPQIDNADNPGAGANIRLVEHAGPGAFADDLEPIDRLQDELGVSLLSRRPWLEAWAEAAPCWQPWMLALIEDQTVAAVAPLARRRTRLGVQIVALGHDELAETPLAARDGAAATRLAAGLAQALRGLNSAWTLCLRQLPVGASLTDALVSQFQGALVTPGHRRPVLRLTDDRPPKRWLTQNTAKAMAKARNRIGREGHDLEVDWFDRWELIRDLLPEVRNVHRASDLELRGSTLLDDARQGRFYDQVLVRHTERLRLLTARIDGSLAGYALCLEDGEVLRVQDNRVAPAWRRYSTGLIANAEVVQIAASMPSITVVDWGCGEQRYKLSLSNEVIGAEVLTAWSSPLRRAAWAYHTKLTSRSARSRPRH